MPKTTPKIVYSILILTFLLSGCRKQPNYGKAPQFTLLDTNGNQVALSDFQGKVVILNFWATWCPGCVKEVPHFIELHDKYKTQGLQILGISLDQGGANDVKPFIEKKNVNYTMLIGSQNIVDKYRTKGLMPTTFVIDKTGQIRRKYVGYRKKSVFEKDIKLLLAEQPTQDEEKKQEKNTPPARPKGLS